jgi:hypothetical protein
MANWDIATKKPGLGEGRAWFYDLRLIPDSRNQGVFRFDAVF